MRSLHSQHYRRFVAVLAQARVDAGLTQQTLAEQLRKPQSYVSKVERSERRLDVPEFIAYARALGHDPAELIRAVEHAFEEGRLSR